MTYVDAVKAFHRGGATARGPDLRVLAVTYPKTNIDFA